MPLTVLALTAAAAPAQEPAHHLLTPQLASRGAPIVGRVIERTDGETRPVEAGRRALIRGTVVDDEPAPGPQTVGAGGRIVLPTLWEVGNRILEVELLAADAPAASVPLPAVHIEVVDTTPGLPTRVAHSDAVIGGSAYRVAGTGLETVARGRAWLEGAAGEMVALDDPVGSDLEILYPLPEELDAGHYRYVAQDADGTTHRSPTPGRVPSCQIEGTPVTQRLSRGRIGYRCDANGTLVLHGGLPHIQLDTHRSAVAADQPGVIGFLARQVGEYELTYEFFPAADPAAPTDRRPVRAALASAPSTRSLPDLDQTEVRASVRVVDESGSPIGGAPVRVALAHPGGVSYLSSVTDAAGRAEVDQLLPGRVDARTVAVHPYQVVGYAWSTTKTPCAGECAPKCSEKRTPADVEVKLSTSVDADAAKESRAGAAELEKRVQEQAGKIGDCGNQSLGGEGTEEQRDQGRVGYNYGAGMVMSVSDAAATHVLAKSFAREIKKLGVGFTTEAPAGKALELSTKGSREFEVRCVDGEECGGPGCAVGVVAAFGASKMMDPAADAEFVDGLSKAAKRALELGKDAIEEIPVLGKVLKWLLDAIDFSANVKSRARSKSTVTCDGKKATAHTSTRADLVRNKDGTTPTKEVTPAEPDVASTSKRFESRVTCTFASEADGMAKATGIGRTTSEASTLYVFFHSLVCRECGRFRWQSGMSWGYLGMRPDGTAAKYLDDKLSEAFDAAQSALKDQEDKEKKDGPPMRGLDCDAEEAELRSIVEAALARFEQDNQGDDSELERRYHGDD